MPQVENAMDIIGMLVWLATPVAGTVWVAWLAQRTRRHEERIADLERDVTEVRQERDELRHLFRLAVHHIRDWLEWSRNHPTSMTPPELPPELADEV